MIKIFITGGTIDSEKIKKGGDYVYGKTHIPEMLRQSRCKIKIRRETLFLKDSLYLNDSDRKKILESCRDCRENKIVITHGTDTMTETAKTLGKNIKNKVIVLLGAMIPYNQDKSDSLFNLGCAVAAVQLLPDGVYIAMNGRIFPWDNVKKNRKLGVFENIK